MASHPDPRVPVLSSPPPPPPAPATGDALTRLAGAAERIAAALEPEQRVAAEPVTDHEALMKDLAMCVRALGLNPAETVQGPGPRDVINAVILPGIRVLVATDKLNPAAGMILREIRDAGYAAGVRAERIGREAFPDVPTREQQIGWGGEQP